MSPAVVEAKVGSFHFVAFGLHIVADQELPGLTPLAAKSSEPDLRVWLGAVPPSLVTDAACADPISAGRTPDEASESWVTVWKYDEFFRLWKDADADLPVLIEAKKEYEKLK